MGTQKSHLNETVLLSTQNIFFKMMGKKIHAITIFKYAPYNFDIWPRGYKTFFMLN